MSQSKHHDEIAIELTGVSKKYEIHHEKPTLVEKFVKGRNETFWALGLKFASDLDILTVYEHTSNSNKRS